MKTSLTAALLILCFFYNHSGHAQNYTGITVDNYSGLHGVIYNPSSVVDSRFRSEINLLSISGFAGSDYYGLDINSILNFGSSFNFDNPLEKSPKNDNQFFSNADILGPSVMFNLSPRSSIAITTRGRAFVNYNNVNGLLYENLNNDFDQEENFSFEVNDLSGTTHAWGELGITYGRILMEREIHFIKGGVTLKYLDGAGSKFVHAPRVDGMYDATAESLTTSGSLRFGSTNEFDSKDINLKNSSSGFGADLGFIYEYRPYEMEDPQSRKINKYKLKVGASITDVGSISYDGTTVNSYNINSTVDVNQFENKDFEMNLQENYEGTETLASSKINLPTAFHLFADYEIQRRLYVSLQGSFSLVSANRDLANRFINTVTATPRFETSWLSLYLPLSIRQYDGFAMGAGARLGPVFIGSSTIFSNLFSNSTGTADIYAGLKIPIYQ